MLSTTDTHNITWYWFQWQIPGKVADYDTASRFVANVVERIGKEVQKRFGKST